MRAHSDALFRTACSMLNSEEEARDATQEAFIKLFKSETNFKDNDHVRCWLIRVVQNDCIDRQRRAKRVAIDLVDPTEPDAIERLIGDRALLSQSEVELDEDHFLWRHVATLSEDDRRAVHLRYAEDLSLREIAQITGWSYGATGTRLCRACKKLRRLVEAELEQRKEEDREKIDKKTIRDVPQADPHADLRGRGPQRDDADHSGSEGRASPKRGRRSRGSSRRPDGGEDGFACAVVAVGVALFAVAGIAPTVDREHSIATASSPLLPYQRIQFDHNSEGIFEADDGVYITVPILLALPGNPAGDATVSLNGAENTLLSTEWFPREESEPGSASIQTKIVSGLVSAYAIYRTSLNHADFMNGTTVPSGWTWDPTDAINMIEDLRNCEIVVTPSAGSPVAYTINFDDYPTREDIADRLYSRAGFRLTYFSLDRNEDQ
ncbi:RNA polymerase sigma factor [Adlercreutzia caecimuris]|uniref:RNA polymerase sigma factor n=1 Tax=Adlercreutzia caecimuris TaxID=671266 RepID=UPI00272B8503|nr:RNA polymerase sigma factor [Adlercreutzia caecimuris]